jgi:hypothetical protein
VTTIGRWRVSRAVLLALVVCYPATVPAQDRPPAAAMLEMVHFAREEAASDRVAAERQLERAGRYRSLEIDALRSAEHATDPGSRQSWLDSAQRHARSASRLEEQSRQLRARADVAEARAEQLEVALDQRRPAP